MAPSTVSQDSRPLTESSFSPVAPEGSNSSRTAPVSSWTKLSKWITGPDLVMEIDVDPDMMQQCRTRWEEKWLHYEENFAENLLDHINGMGQNDMRERTNWLEADFGRIKENIPVLSTRTTDSNVLGGLAFLGEFIEACQPDLTAARAGPNQGADTASDSGFLIQIEKKLKSVEKTHRFALLCISEIIGLKQTLAVKSQRNVVKISEGSAESESESMRAPLDDERFEAPQPVALHTSEINSRNEPHVPAQVPNLVTFQSEDLGPGRLFGRRTSGDQLNLPQTVVSSSSSHLKNLTSLMAIAFFGASITWSTIFSGTRGNLVLISWSACLFIVGAVAAGAASMLVLPEEDIVSRHMPVRWTVRILSVLAMMHLLVGMFLVTLAILLLDPGRPSPDSLQSVSGTRGAGGYAIAVSLLFVVVAGAVWRRFTTRTWFV
ncbi:hypothetical protein C8R43DRAFT_1206927 [Mycena crocata]|nr:hypothetical protein C8R43DRAFT_1206927 [Mycena crocata]